MKKQWVIVKLRISKGDVYDEVDIETFSDEIEAKQALEKYKNSVSPCWPDFDDYTISVREIPDAA